MFKISLTLALSLFPTVTWAAPSIDLRQSNFHFMPDIDSLRQGKIQNFFQAYDKQGEVISESFPNEPFNLESLFSLDKTEAYKRARSEGTFLLVSKVAFLVKKNADFFSTRALSPSFWQAVQPSHKFKVESSSASTNHSISMRAIGLPTYSTTVKLFDSNSDISDIQAVAQENRALGEPVFYMSEHYTKFEKIVLGTVKTNLESRTIWSFYQISSGETLVINISLTYPFRLLPNFLGGLNEMRAFALNKISEIVRRVETL